MRRTWDKLGYFPTNQQVKRARLIVADLDEPISRFRMSKSVTVRPVYAESLLQIETFFLDVFLCLNL